MNIALLISLVILGGMSLRWVLHHRFVCPGNVFYRPQIGKPLPGPLRNAG